MIPKPRNARLSSGTLDLRSRAVRVVANARDERVQGTVALFEEDLKRLGLEVASGREQTNAISLELCLVEEGYGAEEYRLEVLEDRVSVSASDPAGLFYGTRSILSAAASGPLVQGVISDGPRYSWRGAHLDVARHFFSVESVKRFIDLIALHKMNVFHWHLTEDQGWRIQIDAFPKLTEIAAYRRSPEGKYGGFYTKDEVREVVAYAQARFVQVIPEIEMPGHAVAALAAYPELSCAGGPFEVETEWGIFDDVYCAGNDAAFDFLEKVLDEVIELFPSEFFHVGGDECPKKRWKACPKCQARMKAEGLRSEDELQSWFIRRMSKYLGQRGKRLVGWDEILEGGLAPGATVMSWRGTEGGIRAAQMNHDVVMTPTSHCYFDYRQVSDEAEPGAWFAPALDLETVYSYEPTPTELTSEQAAHVLGVQGNIWTEKMPHFKQVEYMTFPRLCALSEVGWSGPERDFEEFTARLDRHLHLLDAYGVGYRGSDSAEPVTVSAEERARYLAAKKERERSQAVAAY